MTFPKEYILWLPSWYPNKSEPFNGDFIQRHAHATSKYCNLIVIQFLQLTERIRVEKEITTVNRSNNLIEITVTCSFIPTGIKILDKTRYNFNFYNTAKKTLEKLFKENGLPKLVHVHIPLKAGNLALWIKKRYKIEYIVSEQSSHYMNLTPDSYFKKSFIHKKQLELIFKKARIVTNVSAAIGIVLKKIFSLQNVTVVHNTVDTSYFNYQKEKEAFFTYIHVSSLNEQKNTFGMLHAFKKLKEINHEWRLQLVGPLKKEIEDYINKNSLGDHIKQIGEIPYEKVAKYMKCAHVFVLFSRHENFPCVVVEALCCGLPVIATNVAGVKEAVYVENGILISSEDEDALLHSLVTIRKNYSLYNQQEISKKASEKYNYDEIGRQFFELYSI